MQIHRVPRPASRDAEPHPLTHAATLVERVVEVYRDRGELIDSMNREPVSRSIDRILEQIHKYAKADKQG